MKRLKRHYSLFEIEPSLVKEWHPSANGELTPRNVKIDYPKKVWWICDESHEWPSTIKSRMKLHNCPICEKSEPRNARNASSGPPIIGRNLRGSRRFKTKVTAVIEIPDSGHWVYAEMRDYSRQGLGLETEAAIKPGVIAQIKFDKTLISSGPDRTHISSTGNGYKTFSTMVKWCKKLDDDHLISNYGIGVALF